MSYRACDGRSRPKAVDPRGYRLVGCKVGANATRLRDEAVAAIAKRFRASRVDAVVEPTRLLADAAEGASLRGPRGLGRQAVDDVAAAGVDSQSRASDEAVERPL